MSATRDRTVEELALGIVLERRRSSHPWQDHSWHVVDVLLGGGPAGPWRELAAGDGWVRHYAGTLSLSLHADAVPSYRYNLAGRTPAIYVVLRPSKGPFEVVPFLATACPVEAQDYLGSGDELVEAVPMPPALFGWIQRFVNRHPVEETFVKRARSPKSGADFARPASPIRGRGDS